MLGGKLVRVRYSRNRVIPSYIPLDDPGWIEVAGRMRELFLKHHDRRRSELDEEIRESFGAASNPLVYQGLAKILEDRSEFEQSAPHPPEQLRQALFQAAAAARASSVPDQVTRAEASKGPEEPSRQIDLDRASILRKVAHELNLTTDAVEQGLFADLKSEQILVRFKDISPERLLERYNVGLAQAILLRSVCVAFEIRNEPPARFRQLFRMLKFHRLLCEVKRQNANVYSFVIDGPLSLFSATQKYGLQLALFLPSILLCSDFDLKADLRWGPQRKPKEFTITAADGLKSHHSDSGTFVPPELAMFAELFRKKISDWELREEVEVLALGDSCWVPDFRLVHKPSDKAVFLEVLGFWRRSSAEKHIERLRQHASAPFLLAVSDQLHIEDSELEGLLTGVYRFRQMPLPEEVARFAKAALGMSNDD